MIEWFRWWHGTVTDPKFQSIATKTKQSVATVVAVWASLMEHASSVTQCNAGNASVTRGNISEFNCADYDELLRLESGVTQIIFDAMTGRGLIEKGYLSAWNKRQPKREDPSAERVRAYREKKKEAKPQAEHLDDVTQCNAMKQNVTLDKDTDKELIKKEVKKKKSPSQKTFLSEDFVVTAKHREYAQKNNLPSPDDEIESFKLNHLGKGTMWVNWDFAFYAWLRREKKFQRGSKKINQVSTYEKNIAGAI